MAPRTDPRTPRGDTDLRRAPRRYSRLRRVAVATLAAASRMAGGRARYRARHLAPGRFACRLERVPVRALPAGLEGFRIVHLSDLHAGPFLGPGDLTAVVERANRLEPDLVVLTGDLITHRADEAFGLAGDLGRLRARHGVLAVFGNHDYRERREGEIARRLAPSGVRFLRNECARIDTGAGALAVVGLEDLEESWGVDLAAARAGVLPGDVEVVLCHSPAAAPRLARAQCACVLSGHTHGGQVDLPWVAPPGPAHPGGRVLLGDTRLVVSRGLGVTGLPVRIGAPPEVVVVEIFRARGADGGGAR